MNAGLSTCGNPKEHKGLGWGGGGDAGQESAPVICMVCMRRADATNVLLGSQEPTAQRSSSGHPGATAQTVIAGFLCVYPRESEIPQVEHKLSQRGKHRKQNPTGLVPCTEHLHKYQPSLHIPTVIISKQQERLCAEPGRPGKCIPREEKEAWKDIGG